MRGISVEVRQDRDITRFTCTGEADPVAYREIIGRVRSTMEEPSRGRKVFLDLTGVEGGLAEFDKFTLAEYASTLLTGLRIGTLMNPRAPLTRFGENTAVNRGITLLVSYEEGELKEWLALASPDDRGCAVAH